MKSSAPNRNAFFAGLVIEELYRCGVRHLWAAPGSRSSALVLAAAQHGRLLLHMHFDERGCAFAALGAARTGQPAAVLTTSGTAAANLLPAIVEASLDHVPLVAITADRPSELRHSGANQTVDQVKLFNSSVRFYAELPSPDDAICPRDVLSLVDLALAKATGPESGPVHLNCPFREPLAPVPLDYDRDALDRELREWRATARPLTNYVRPLLACELPDFDDVLERSDRAVLVAGALQSDAERRALIALSQRTNWPILADVLSGLRSSSYAHVIRSSDAILLEPRVALDLRPDLVIQVGGRLVSKRLGRWVSSGASGLRMRVHPSTDRLDPERCFTHRVISSVEAFAAAVAARMRKGRSSRATYLKSWIEADRKASVALGVALRFDEPTMAKIVSEAGAGQLVLASSMPVRDADLMAEQTPSLVVSNRGASGIDGTIATACGLARATRKSTIVHIGDLALLHDLNSLAMAKDLDTPFVIVCVNNDGGGIFDLLPIADHREHFERCFGTPHGLGFKSAARLFGLPYASPRTLPELRRVIAAGLARKGASFVEVRTNRNDNAKVHQRLHQRIVQALHDP